MQHLTNYMNISNRLKFNLRTEPSSGQDYNGYYKNYGKVLTLVNIDESRTMRANYNGETLIFKRSIKNVFVHELTHHLQHLDSKYNGMYDLGYIGKDSIHRNGIYAYNEIVANTVSMLIYMNEDSVNDNLAYVNFYINKVKGTHRNANKQAFNERLQEDLKADIDKYYKIIKEQLIIEGLI